MGCVGMKRTDKVPQIVVKRTAEDRDMSDDNLFIIREESARNEESCVPSRFQSGKVMF